MRHVIILDIILDADHNLNLYFWIQIMIFLSNGESVPKISHNLIPKSYTWNYSGPDHDLKTCSAILHL
jgi:hypothetical protein